jgi:hypothetical protein
MSVSEILDPRPKGPCPSVRTFLSMLLCNKYITFLDFNSYADNGTSTQTRVHSRTPASWKLCTISAEMGGLTLYAADSMLFLHRFPA